MATLGRSIQPALIPIAVGLNSIELTGSGVVTGSPGFLAGIFVASGNAPTFKFYDNASAASGTVLVNTFTPVLGWNPCPLPLQNGLYVTVGGTVDATFTYS